jgi:hypothetical protein
MKSGSEKRVLLYHSCTILLEINISLIGWVNNDKIGKIITSFRNCVSTCK